MTTNLAQFIAQTPLCDTHEHLRSEAGYLENPPDILQNLFDNYVSADLIVAGATQADVDALLDNTNPDIRQRFAAIQPAWEAVRHTGYGEAVRIIARELYGLEEITADGLETAKVHDAGLAQPGMRLQILRERANLDHVQTDDFTRPCPIDEAGPEFFFFDISWANFCNGRPDLEPLATETGIEITDVGSLRRAMAAVFAQNTATAIAVKSQHAYTRTLQWQERSDRDAALALAAYLKDPDHFSEEDRLCLGDWCWARGIELAIEHDLPFKIHTGYYAGHSRMPVDYIKSGHLCPLLAKYLDARFVLMHIAYPYSDELIALAKHYPNVYIDVCWAWSINPFHTGDFIRRYIHAVPSNKLFLFGGDTFFPTAALAYAQQARHWFTRALQAEVDDALLTENEAIALAARFMRENQYVCFQVEEKRQAIRNQ